MGLESGRYDTSDDNRVTDAMRSRVRERMTMPVAPLPEAHQALVERIRMHKKVVGALSSAAHYLTVQDYEKMLIVIAEAAPNKSKESYEDDYPENNVQIGES